MNYIMNSEQVVVECHSRKILHKVQIVNRKDGCDGIRRSASIYYRVRICFYPVGLWHAQSQLVDLRLPDRQHPRPGPLHHPHLPLHLPGQGPETWVGFQNHISLFHLALISWPGPKEMPFKGLLLGKTSSQAPRCASWKAHKLTNWQAYTFTSYQTDRWTGWQDDKLTSWQADMMTWQVVKNQSAI